MNSPAEIVTRALARAKRNREKYNNPTDMERILTLPAQDFSAREDLQAKWTNLLTRGGHDFGLRRVQAEFLEECSWAAEQEDPIGALGHVGVGKGKTLTFWLVPGIFKAKRPVLLLPPDMRDQYADDLFEWSQRYHFVPPIVVYYSQLSRPEGTSLLEELNPDLIMADEAHMLRHATSARTKRFLRYMAKHPKTRFVAMSGTLTGSTLSDYAHLSYLALRQYSPLPHDERNIDLWGTVLNAEGEPDNKAWQALTPLSPKGAPAKNVSLVRKDFNLRFRTAPGAVSTRTSSCDARLELTAAYPQLSASTKDTMATVREDWELPNGDKIVDALHFYRAMSQLSSGFYYVWDWPNDEPDKDWLYARREWWSWCRWYLTRFAREGCDSPYLVEKWLRNNNGTAAKEGKKFLERWDAEKSKDPPPTRPIWVDTAVVTSAVKWANSRDRGFVWYGSRAMGDMLDAWGVPTFGVGDGAPNPDQHPVAALSIPIYHKGRNFQPWADQLIIDPMSSAITWQQLLGRTHRNGQRSGVVKATVNQHTWYLRQAYRRATARARYIQETTGEAQKLLLSAKQGFLSGEAPTT